MIVKMLTSMAGVDFSHAPGDVVKFSEDEAKRLIDSGVAEKASKEAVDSFNGLKKKAAAEKKRIAEELADLADAEATAKALSATEAEEKEAEDFFAKLDRHQKVLEAKKDRLAAMENTSKV